MVTIAVIAAGAMGSAVSRRLVAANCTVLTNLEGRSEGTRRRAIESGMKDASLLQIANEANYVLSILPPSSAFSFAERFLQDARGAVGGRGQNDPLIFADCNAVNPSTVKRIAALFADSTPAIGFVDSGIIGGPPKDTYDPTFYASADDRKALESFGELSMYGLKVNLMKEGRGVGDASAVKMSYAGLTKGTTALFATMILAAHASSPATAEALLDELKESQPEMLKRIARVLPPSFPKAYRWVHEMEEIAGFVGAGEGSIYTGIAKLYERMDGSLNGDQEDIETLSRFVQAAEPHSSPPSPRPAPDSDDHAWGSNFWVTLVEPESQSQFFACPATGQVSWDPPTGNFVLPPSEDGEWWELTDDSRGGIPYYHHTKTGETVWERPQAFVIPLGILQNTALGKRLSNRFSKSISDEASAKLAQISEKSSFRRSLSNSHDPSLLSPNGKHTSPNGRKQPSIGSQRQFTNELGRRSSNRLPPIPASPYSTDVSVPPSPAASQNSLSNRKSPQTHSKTDKDPSPSSSPGPPNRARSKSSSYVSRKPTQPQSLNAAVELLATSQSEGGQLPKINTSPKSSRSSSGSANTTPKLNVPPSPHRNRIPSLPNTPSHRNGRNVSGVTVAGKGISAPILNHAATLDLSPVKNRAAGKPIPVQPIVPLHPTPSTTKSSGTYPVLPHDLASDILQFSESDFAKQYFSTHRSGFIFKRRIPVTQLMVWQKAPLSSPLLTLKGNLGREAVKIFKVIQHVMGDRDKDRPVGVRAASDNYISTVAPINSSTTSLSHHNNGVLEEERWLLGEGVTHGELRDEIYCQVMKQLTKNPNAENVFKGWQLLCVLLVTFPPSKDFETYLRAFMQSHGSHTEGRLDVMAKFCLRRLDIISRKGPRGKPPSISEIETASDAAFNPSTFGEPLGAIIRLQERTYPEQKVPIILPFLADGILALGGTKSEGIFRVPGDSDSVSELKLRIDRGYYSLEGVDDPNVLASLLKLWLRELCEPLVPEEMYNECVANSKDPEACIHIVRRLPTISRRVILFVISFFQLFLEQKVQNETKMTPANLALVMAPNVLRCNSDSMAVVFTNAQYEQIFVYNLLLHLKCAEIDTNYVPAHGLGAVQPSHTTRKPKSRSRIVPR
ncbi:hypothetical protein D9757_005647 [Collybiopsis confluens]|uniref:Rho GTPase-activating protein 39 n=1 Tax=Collybiopsis confluens TaxID=2823264 RepID=A0A8H5HSS5_9AGAR|nr:hypothetical protein D9757_005647 [Collybiopsis confluens]